MPGWLSGIFAYFMGVPVFFALSGMLIWNSIGNSRSFGHYAKKRILRIYPELWCAVALNLVVILVLYKEPIQWISMGLFTVTQSTFLQFWTPGFLRGYGCGTPNGSLWTICAMVQFYVVAYFLYKLLRGKKLWVWLSVLAASVAVAVATPVIRSFMPEMIGKLYGQTLLPYLWMFLLGALVAEKQAVMIYALKKTWLWLSLLALSLALGLLGLDVSAGNYPVLRSITLYLGLVGFAYCWPKLNIKTDISYGIYLYHMVVVNGMIALGFTGRVEHLVIVLAISCVLAWFSQKFAGIWMRRWKK